MTTSLLTIEHQDETLTYTNMKEALVGLVKEGETSGLLFIKIETEEITFSEESVEEFEKLEKYPLQYTFNFAIAEIESQEVEATSISELIGKTMEFESNGNAILYIRTHLEINQNKVQIDQDGAELILTWTGVTGDINYYDDRAKPNRIYIKAPVKLKQYDSVDQYYQLEYRNKIKD